MRRNLRQMALLAGTGAVLSAASAIVTRAQSPDDPIVQHAATLAGRTDVGQDQYRRFCEGCHGREGDGNGENAIWIDPKPRDFTAAVFKCRSTPSGTLPTDADLIASIRRGFVTSNMPPWRPLVPWTDADLLAYIKTFSPRWKTEKPGTPIVVPPETPATVESIRHGRELFQKMECWKCHGPQGHGDGPSASTLTDSKDNPIRPYNFSAGTRFKCGSSDRDLYRIFETGVDGTPMPSFADNLKGNDGWDLVHFLRTLQPIYTPETLAWKQWVATHGSELKPIGPEGQ
jgi:mono/diheme cytochrome c family protein